MKQTILAAFAAIWTLPAAAQVAVTTSALSYTQDFNALDSMGTGLTAMPPGWSFYEWGGSSANTSYRASTGSATSGDTYSFGAAGSADRALGSLCSSGVPNISYGVRFVNQTGAYINAVTITFKVEQWRRNGSGKADSVLFMYSSASGRTIADTALSSWNGVGALLMTSVTTALPASATNGNDTAKVLSTSLPIALPAGDTICFRWHDFNGVGNDDGLSIDSLTVVFNIGPPASANKPGIVSLDPAPNAVSVPIGSSLSIGFDKAIVKGGAGNIYIKDRFAQTTQIVAVASANVIVSSRTATVNSVILQSGRTYHVTFDSTAFDTAGFHSTGLYDTAAWAFSTVSTGVMENRTPGILSFSIKNPVRNGVIELRCAPERVTVLSVTVCDLSGRALFRSRWQMVPGINRIALNSALPAGTYYVHLTYGERSETLRIEIQ